MGNAGTLFGLGVGPGDPELVTIKTYRIMKETPVIAYPKKRMGGKSYALEIVELLINPAEKTMLGLVFPMTRDPDVLRREWEQTVDAVWQHLEQGKDVAFVTEGDPMLYSTFIHLSRLVKERHPEANVASVPGISSMSGAASRLGVALADGDETVAIVPATSDRERMKNALLANDCVVFIKVAKVLDDVIDLLEDLRLEGNAMVATLVTSANEMVWHTVTDLRGADLNYLTLMVVRK